MYGLTGVLCDTTASTLDFCLSVVLCFFYIFFHFNLREVARAEGGYEGMGDDWD